MGLIIDLADQSSCQARVEELIKESICWSFKKRLIVCIWSEKNTSWFCELADWLSNYIKTTEPVTEIFKTTVYMQKF